MKKLLKIVLALFTVLALLTGIGLIALITTFPRVAAAPKLTIKVTPELLARGDYLFNHQCSCVGCHSQRDWSRRDGPVTPGSEGGGGDAFDAAAGVPGTVYGRNLTPVGLKDWSDGEILRAISSGVSKDGTPLFPLMPYSHYAKLAESDLAALVAYLRTLKPIEKTVPAHSLDFPMNLIVRMIPTTAQPPATVPAATDPAYGAYVVNAAACLHCHSPSDHGAIKPGQEFIGGVPFPMPGVGLVRSANLTPDQTTGLGAWTKPMFIGRFKAGLAGVTTIVKPGELSSPMPWTAYGGMSDQDLGAIYDCLHALKPVTNAVVKVTSP